MHAGDDCEGRIRGCNRRHAKDTSMNDGEASEENIPLDVQPTAIECTAYRPAATGSVIGARDGKLVDVRRNESRRHPRTRPVPWLVKERPQITHCLFAWMMGAMGALRRRTARVANELAFHESAFPQRRTHNAMAACIIFLLFPPPCSMLHGQFPTSDLT
jgi:hypothetical protein